MAKKNAAARFSPRAATDPHRVAPPSVGAALASLRQSEGLSLDALARQSGVSKSMLSQIERDKTNPTVAVVWRLAQALGVEVSELLGGVRTGQHTINLVPKSQTPSMRTADGKCELRILGPVELAGRFEWYEITLQPGGALRSEAHPPGSREHLTVLNGLVTISSGDRTQPVIVGETARYAADVPHAIVNEAKAQAIALLVVLHPRS
jgi:XRE family transcriptional regulator, regulator of sulfur utilization